MSQSICWPTKDEVDRNINHKRGVTCSERDEPAEKEGRDPKRIKERNAIIQGKKKKNDE